MSKNDDTKNALKIIIGLTLAVAGSNLLKGMSSRVGLAVCHQQQSWAPARFFQEGGKFRDAKS